MGPPPGMTGDDDEGFARQPAAASASRRVGEAAEEALTAETEGGPPGPAMGQGPGGFGPPGGRHEPLYPKQLHEWAGLAIAVVGVVHILLNSRALLRYVGLRRRSRPDLAAQT